MCLIHLLHNWLCARFSSRLKCHCRCGADLHIKIKRSIHQRTCYAPSLFGREGGKTEQKLQFLILREVLHGKAAGELFVTSLSEGGPLRNQEWKNQELENEKVAG